MVRGKELVKLSNNKGIVRKSYEGKILSSSVLSDKDGKNIVKIEARTHKTNDNNKFELNIIPKKGKKTTFSNFTTTNDLIKRYKSEIDNLIKKGYKKVAEENYFEESKSIFYSSNK
ncbi:MAG: hypothetical protein ACP5RI_01440 [Candidatus Micrarchaeia archaeon]